MGRHSEGYLGDARSRELTWQIFKPLDAPLIDAD